MIKLKRVYEEAAPGDGTRILVERLWPRGMTKAKVAADLWLKEAAPSPELRPWFGHDPGRWEEFRRRYRAELEQKPELLAQLRQKSREGAVTFISAARDEEHNAALALREILEGQG